MAVAMLTSRIDAHTKEVGNEVFAQLGYTATDVIQRVWNFAYRNAGEPEKVEAALAAMEPEDSERAERLEKLAKLEAAADAFVTFRKAHGATKPHGLTDEELKYQAMMEKYGEGWKM